MTAAVVTKLGGGAPPAYGDCSNVSPQCLQEADAAAQNVFESCTGKGADKYDRAIVVDDLKEDAASTLGCLAFAESSRLRRYEACQKADDSLCGTCQRCNTQSFACEPVVCGSCEACKLGGANVGQCVTLCKSDEVCVNGVCKKRCESPRVQCGDQCVDTTSDSQNCGSCGNVCSQGNICVNGTCTQCQSGQKACPDAHGGYGCCSDPNATCWINGAGDPGCCVPGGAPPGGCDPTNPRSQPSFCCHS